MKLSELKDVFTHIECVQDGIFTSLTPLVDKGNTKDSLTFLMNEKYVELLFENSSVSCFLCSKEVYTILNERYVDKLKKYGIVCVETPRSLFFDIHTYLQEHTNFYPLKNTTTYISKTASIHPTAIIEEGVNIEDDVVIGPYTYIQKGTRIGKKTRIDGYCNIGAQTFTRNEYSTLKPGYPVELGENIHIFSHVVLEAGLYRASVIQKNVVIGPQSTVEHDVTIEEGVTICAHVCIAGRVKLQKDVYIGPNATLRNGICIFEHGRVSMGSVVTRDVDKNQTVTGNFAIEHDIFLEHYR